MSNKVIDLSTIIPPEWLEEITINNVVYKIGDIMQLPDYRLMPDYHRVYNFYSNKRVKIEKIENPKGCNYEDGFGKAFTYSIDPDDHENWGVGASLFAQFSNCRLVKKSLSSFLLK